VACKNPYLKILIVNSSLNPPCRTSTRWIEILFGIDSAFLECANGKFYNGIVSLPQCLRSLDGARVSRMTGPRGGTARIAFPSAVGRIL
jgi:hypothetical protein